jgi:myb proto-oncogene protein
VCVAPTYAVTVAASLPSSQASYAYAPRRSWKPEEDAKLTEAVLKFGEDWVAVALFVPGRTNKQFRKRWVDYVDPSIPNKRWALYLHPTIEQITAPKKLNKRKWTAEEDAKLTDAVTELGKDWVQAAAMVPGRTTTQCRNRWVECLDPFVNRGRWAAKGDEKLTAAVMELGNDWVRVAALVPGRTNNQCRLRWAKLLK